MTDVERIEQLSAMLVAVWTDLMAGPPINALIMKHKFPQIAEFVQAKLSTSEITAESKPDFEFRGHLSDGWQEAEVSITTHDAPAPKGE